MISKRWRVGGEEPKVEELLGDPIVELILRRDRITLDDVWNAIRCVHRERRVRVA